MSHRRILSVNDIISHLEDNDDVLSADIYITPPDNYDKSDEDSGDEESSNINHLSRQQLLAQAEFRATVSSQSNLDIIESVSNEVSIDNNTHGDLSVQPPAKKKKCPAIRKWRKVDIPVKTEKTSEPPHFLEHLDTPVHFFELFFDEDVFELIRSETEKKCYSKRLPQFQRASTGNTHPELGVGASVVLDLISKLPPGTYSFYMDNYFTSLPLLDEIKTLGHDATGTVRANRVEKAPLKEAKDMKKMSRGSFDQCTDTLTNITLVRYNDNNIVTVASTECGVEPLAKLYQPPAVDKYQAVKTRLLAAYEKSDVKNFQKLISGLELGDQKPSQLLRKMRELSSGMVTDEGLRIEWLNQLPTQFGFVKHFLNNILGISPRTIRTVIDATKLNDGVIPEDQQGKQGKHCKVDNEMIKEKNSLAAPEMWVEYVDIDSALFTFEEHTDENIVQNISAINNSKVMGMRKSRKHHYLLQKRH
ncbi:unnamed protein product [Danaus chrysippus]|uniref:(African queen) hypothetical protein n=1 Tax=Danaus chrysippus TaxID=151541 RepID=A0A8J2QYR4_9NEOP|nr:unnamed protein product [Danaus chrysippus]